MVDEIERALREQLDVRPARREGEGDAGWWLLDYIDVVVHVFGPEERAFYDLERLWRDAPATRLGRAGRGLLRPLDSPLRAHSSAGRALGWQPRGQGFESPWVHFRRSEAVSARLGH